MYSHLKHKNTSSMTSTYQSLDPYLDQVRWNYHGELLKLLS